MKPKTIVNNWCGVEKRVQPRNGLCVTIHTCKLNKNHKGKHRCKSPYESEPQTCVYEWSQTLEKS